MSLGYITRIEGNAGRRDARGDGFELRSDGRGAVRAALGMLVTTVARLAARGRVTEIDETTGRLAACDIHEEIAREAQRHGTQDAQLDQAEVAAAMTRTNAELRGKPHDPYGNPFPEFEAPHLALSSDADLVADAARHAHFASQRHTAVTAGGHVSLAAGKSFLASVHGKIAFYARRAIRLMASGPVHIESRADDVDVIAERMLNLLSKQGEIRLKAKRIVLEADDSRLVLDRGGIVAHTHAEFATHAASHAMSGPEGKPVDFPVTADRLGKLAAHHILVEHEGGFAIPDQPYRIVLDDGQIVRGVTNELGEMQMVTSNAVAFGLVEVMSQSEPEHVIGMARTTVYRGVDLPSPAADTTIALQTVKAGGRTVSTPWTGATTQDQVPGFLTCDPLNFGLRSYRYIGKAKAEPLSIHTTPDVEYSVAKGYTAAVKEALRKVDWGRFVSEGVQGAIVGAVNEPLHVALQAGPFGIAETAMPDITIATNKTASELGISLDGIVAAAFVSHRWIMGIAQPTIDRLFTVLREVEEAGADRGKLVMAKFAFDTKLQDLAATIYHEARHCQQTFWMVSLFGNYPGDYKRFSVLEKMLRAAVDPLVFELAERTPFPEDERVKIGVHRMLLFYYWWFIVAAKDKPGWEFLRVDVERAQAEICKLRGVTSEQALQMAQFSTGYRSHCHEEDAYATEDAVIQYWHNGDHAFVLNPGVCTAEYRSLLGKLGVDGNG